MVEVATINQITKKGLKTHSYLNVLEEYVITKDITNFTLDVDVVKNMDTMLSSIANVTMRLRKLISWR